jgi:hypothetical protein
MISHGKDTLENLATSKGDLPAKNFGMADGELREDECRSGLLQYGEAKMSLLASL